MTRRGWCPSLATPMPSGDGLLVRVRVRPRGGRLTAAQARALAEAARACGNGLVQATSRGSLQVRGLSAATVASFAEAMAQAELAAAPPGDVIASPLAGLDPALAPGTESVAAALEAGLGADPAFAALPPKFAFLVDGGGMLPLGGVRADIRLLVEPGHTVLALDGVPQGRAVPTDSAAALALDLARRFLACSGPARRMRDLPEAGVLLAGLGLPAPLPLPAPARAPVGALPGCPAFGVGLPFGFLDAPTLLALAALSERFGDGTLRLTPFRALLLAGTMPDALPALHAAAEARGLIVRADDARLALWACPGRPACASARADAQADAALLAAAGLAGVHVSGCAKGCAHPAAAPVTLVGTPKGYDLVRNGRAGEAPVQRGLTIGAALAVLQQAG